MREQRAAGMELLQAMAILAPALMKSAAEADLPGRFPTDSMVLLNANGLTAAPLPPALGGVGLNDPAHRLLLLSILKHIGRGDLVVGELYEAHVSALQLIFTFGTPRQQREAADAACNGHWFGVWNSPAENGLRLLPDPAEPPPGPHDGTVGEALGLHPAAQHSGRSVSWRLSGSKTFAPGAGHIARPVVMAERPDGGWQVIALRADERWPVVDGGVCQTPRWRCSASHQVSFEGMAIHDDWLIGPPGDCLRDPCLNAGGVPFAAVQLGGAEALLDETRRLLSASRHCHDPDQQRHLGEMALCVESGNLWLSGAARHVGSVVYAQLMRSAIKQIGLKVMQLAERCVGAGGLVRPESFERMHRDLTRCLRQAEPEASLAKAGAFLLANTQPSHQLWGH